MDNLENYKIYLAFITSKIEKFFEQQKPFIFCHKGCAKCCKNAEFPFSFLEFKYILMGFLTLPPEKQAIIEQNLQNLNEKKQTFNGESRFLYDCPFLIDDVCSVYEYRGVICRAFGLMTQDNENNKFKAPFCYTQGLNYSNVMDFETGKVSGEKVKQLGCEEEPCAYNISYKFLTSDAFEQDFHIQFGDKKPLLNWFIDDTEPKEAENACKQTDL